MYDWTYVISSMISAIAVDGNDLIIKFTWYDSVYRFYDAAEEFEELEDAISVGRYFNLFIKGQYRSEREE